MTNKSSKYFQDIKNAEVDHEDKGDLVSLTNQQLAPPGKFLGLGQDVRKLCNKSKLETQDCREKQAKKKKVCSSPEIDEPTDKLWQPENWEMVIDNIRKMRIHRDAPVDNMGCSNCADVDCPPEV